MEKMCHPGFVYTVTHIGADGSIKSIEKAFNLIPNVAVDYILGASFKATSQYTNWYVSLFNANRTPVPADTMTTFMTDCEENTDYTVIGGNRPLIVFPAIVDGALTTSAAPNIFEFTGASTVRGGFITTNITRGNNTGLLGSEVLFPTSKVMAAGEKLSVPVGFALISV